MSTEARVRPRRVLVVDDDRRVRESIVSLLLLEGLQTLAVECGSQAVEHLEAMVHGPAEASFGFMVVDYNLPDTTGVQILQRTKQEFRLDLPAIVVSGNAGPELERKVRQVGGFALVPKPVEPSEFRLRIRQLISTEI